MDRFLLPLVRPTRDGRTYVSGPPFCSEFSDGSYTHQRSTDCLECEQVESLDSKRVYSPHALPSFWLTICPSSRVMKKSHMYDATEIFRTLAQHKKESFFKLGFYLLSFFYYLFRSVRSLPYLFFTRGVIFERL
jgi:hypothetical protein